MTRAVHRLPQAPALTPAALRATADAVLATHRSGTLAALCRDRPAAMLGCLRRWGEPVLWVEPACTAREPAALAWAWATWLGWGVQQARPDGLPGQPGRPGDLAIPRHAWLGATPWRPLLAVAAHYMLLPIPAFPERYRHRPNEPAFEHLCGLWDIAPSSFYRYVERGRDELLSALLQRPVGPRWASLGDFAEQALAQPAPSHAERADRALARQDAPAALWHAIRADAAQPLAARTRAVAVLERACTELAAHRATEPLLDRAAAHLPTAPLALARAALARVRAADTDEQAHIAQALQSAGGPGSLLASALAARGRYHEPRDEDRAFADYRESIAVYEAALRDEPQAAVGLFGTLVRLGWLYVQRNDPRCKAVLDRAADLREAAQPPLDTQALLEQAVGELRRRQGNDQAALEATHRALQLYERAANRQQALRAHGTLVLLYASTGKPVEASRHAAQVLAAADAGPVEPHTVASTHINLGIASFWAERWTEAVAHYEAGLALALRHSLRTLAGRAHYNLAEALYKRFEAGADPQDELRGDTHASLARTMWELAGDKAAAEATSNLKRTVLGDGEHLIYDRMLPGELAAHFDEMSEIQTERLKQSAPAHNDERIRASLRIARAYTAIAVKEREAAIALVREAADPSAWYAEIEGIGRAFDDARSDKERIATRWRALPACPVPAAQLPALVQHALVHGFLTKSVYATLCGVSGATASKHLAQLTDAGLLDRSGQGPGTRYAVVQALQR